MADDIDQAEVAFHIVRSQGTETGNLAGSAGEEDLTAICEELQRLVIALSQLALCVFGAHHPTYFRQGSGRFVADLHIVAEYGAEDHSAPFYGIGRKGVKGSAGGTRATDDTVFAPACIDLQRLHQRQRGD